MKTKLVSGMWLDGDRDHETQIAIISTGFGHGVLDPNISGVLWSLTRARIGHYLNRDSGVFM